MLGLHSEDYSHWDCTSNKLLADKKGLIYWFDGGVVNKFDEWLQPKFPLNVIDISVVPFYIFDEFCNPEVLKFVEARLSLILLFDEWELIFILNWCEI